MGRALHRRKTDGRHALIENPQEERAQSEQRRAALGYLLWPAALYERFVEREPASSWYRQQVRQALAFGLWSSAIGFVALFWPLVLSLLIGNATVTIVLYAIALVLDVVLLALWFVHALRYSKRAARGETFELHWGVAKR